MNQVQNLNKLLNLSYFDLNTISQIVEVSKNSLYANIKRWIKQDRLIQLKRGLYVTSDYFKLQTDKDIYLEFIANKLREPSYLSTEYVLQNYNIITEAVFAFTSISLKSKREYSNKFGRFFYRSISENLFTGFEIITKGKFQIKIATKAKALFDYLYLKTLRTPLIDKELIESFRLNLDEFTKKDEKEFSSYCKMAGTQKMAILPKIIKELV